MTIRAKITILGDPGVGKTSLILKYITNKFSSDYKPTLGADFLQKHISSEEIPELGEDDLDLVIWDIAGQSSYEIDRMTNYYLQGSNGFVLVYDLTNKTTLKNIENWHKRMLKICGDIPFIVVGNKLDLSDHIEVTDSDLKSYKKKFNCKFLTSSAKTGANVKDLFIEIAKLLIG